MNFHHRIMKAICGLVMTTVLCGVARSQSPAVHTAGHRPSEQQAQIHPFLLPTPVMPGGSSAAAAGFGLMTVSVDSMNALAQEAAASHGNDDSNVDNTPPLVVDVIMALQLPDHPRRLAFQERTTVATRADTRNPKSSASAAPSKPQPRTVQGNDLRTFPRFRTGRARSRQNRRGLFR